MWNPEACLLGPTLQALPAPPSRTMRAVRLLGLTHLLHGDWAGPTRWGRSKKCRRQCARRGNWGRWKEERHAPTEFWAGRQDARAARTVQASWAGQGLVVQGHTGRSHNRGAMVLNGWRQSGAAADNQASQRNKFEAESIESQAKRKRRYRSRASIVRSHGGPFQPVSRFEQPLAGAHRPRRWPALPGGWQHSTFNQMK